MTKGYVFSGLLLFIIGFSACIPVQKPVPATSSPQAVIESPDSRKPIPSTAKEDENGGAKTTTKAIYLTKLERQVIDEINTLRADPPGYAKRVLIPMKGYYKGLLLKLPGETNSTETIEGIAALNNAIKALQTAAPAPSLSPSRGLSLSARDHVKDQSASGDTGHRGKDGSTTEVRINRFGRWDVTAGEDIDYGNNDAQNIVAAQLIDDGVASRSHRKNLLEASFKFVGVSVGTHPTYGHMCVMDFAGAYQPSEAAK